MTWSQTSETSDRMWELKMMVWSLGETAYELADLQNLLRVQTDGRLVQDDNLRQAENRLRQTDALL